MRRSGWIGLAAWGLILSGCGESQPQSAPPPPTATATTPAGDKPGQPPPAEPLLESADVPSEFRELWKEAVGKGKQGEQGGYTYQYAVGGNRAAAVMLPRPIPRDDSILIATISDLARRAFKADLSRATPRLSPTPHGNAITFSIGRRTYYVLPIKNETQEGAYGPGEPHTLLLWRENR